MTQKVAWLKFLVFLCSFFFNLFAHKKLRNCQWRNSMKQYMNYKVFVRSGSRLNFEVLIFGEEIWKPEWLNSWLVLSNIRMVSAEPLSRTGERRVLLLLRQPCSWKPQGSLGGLTGLGRDVVAMPGLGLSYLVYYHMNVKGGIRDQQKRSIVD